jgi:hypothetical protein
MVKLLSRLYNHLSSQQEHLPAETIKQLLLPPAFIEEETTFPESWQQTYWDMIQKNPEASEDLPMEAKEALFAWWDSIVPRKEDDEYT